MKIGILTLHFSKNYGAVLQTYALLSIIKVKGHTPFVIDRVPEYKSFLHKMYHRYSLKEHLSWRKLDQFVKEQLFPKTKRYASFKSLDVFEKEKFDAIIVGSDQVWRFKVVGLNYFLDFVRDSKIRKIAYAASFGKSNWDETDYVEDTDKIRGLLQQFNSISVREDSGVNICKNIFNVDAECVLDPTLLFTGEFYRKTLLSKYIRSDSGKIISYFLGSKKYDNINYCSSLANQYGLVYEDLYTRSSFLHVSVEYWLNEICNAKYVITNSFHGMVFAILFRKFFLIINLDGGGSSRIMSLVAKLGLQKRYVDSITDVTISKLDEYIDYDMVHERLSELRQESLRFLNSSI